MQLIESLCRRFLWTGGTEISKKALIAWDRLCHPKSAGGLGLLDIYAWNRAAIYKHLWNVYGKKIEFGLNGFMLTISNMVEYGMQGWTELHGWSGKF